MTATDSETLAASLITHLQARGFRPIETDNGDGAVPTPTPETMAKEAAACDDAHCYLEAADGKRVWVWLVFGNSPWELPCDYTFREDLDAAMIEWSDRAEQEFGS